MEQAEILIVDDDQPLRSRTARYLQQHGLLVREAGSASEMQDAISARSPNLVLLDLHLPDAHGLTLARELRADPVIGIIIVTGSADDHDKIVGLELGADDYLNKPVDPRELLARIRSTLRRVTREVRASTSDLPADVPLVTTFAHLRIDLIAHKLTNDAGEEIRLTSHEYQLLAHLVENPNKVMSRDYLMNQIAGRDWNATDRSIDTLVTKIRHKIEHEPSRPNLIKTVRGTGYVLTARTRVVPADQL